MSDTSWEIPGITAVPKFLRALLTQLPNRITVSFEIYRAPSAVSSVLLRHRSATEYRPWRDTLFPRTRVYFCDLSSELLTDLNNLLKTYERRKVFWHVKGFVDGKLIFMIHDADMEGSALISPSFTRDVVEAIAVTLKRVPARVDSHVNWDAQWNVLPDTKKEGRKNRAS